MEFRRKLKTRLKSLDNVQKIMIILTIAGFFMLLITLILFKGENIFQTLLIISLMVTGLPYIFYQYWGYQRRKNIEKYLPDYLRDVSESISAGMTLPRALGTATKGSYGILSEEMERTANQISWGIPFEEAMEKFIERNNSPVAKRAVNVIVESHRSGGDIAKTLKTVARDVKTIERLRNERESKLRVYLISIYFIFFLFLGIMTVLTVQFIPATPDLNKAAAITGGTPTELTPTQFKQYFFHLALVEALFAGLIGGQMGEGKVLAGVKHSVIMIVITILVFQVFLVPPGLRQSIAGEIVKMPPGSQGAESSRTTYTIQETLTSEEVAKSVRDLAEEKGLEGYGEIKGSDIFFLPVACTPCEEGRLEVTPSVIRVNEPSNVGVKIMSQEGGSYQVVIGGRSSSGSGGIEALQTPSG